MYIKYYVFQVPVDVVKAPLNVHTTWCLVCGKRDKLFECTNCPSCFHVYCRDDWIVAILRKIFQLVCFQVKCIKSCY